MKPRACRITVGAAALGAGVLAVLVVANWSAVRDHVEAWWFQLMRKTVTNSEDGDDSTSCRRSRGGRPTSLYQCGGHQGCAHGPSLPPHLRC